jgi:predicted DNA binding CopG/RHH family protein
MINCPPKQGLKRQVRVLSRDSSEHLDWSKAQIAAFPNLRPSTKTISLRLPQHLLDAIKTAANARDVPYQSLTKVWLQEKVQRG